MKEWWHYQLFHPRAYLLIRDSDLDVGMMP